MALENPIGTPGNTAIISTDFARQLERELAKTKASISHSAEANKAWLAEFDRLKQEASEANRMKLLAVELKLKSQTELEQWQQMAEELANGLKFAIGPKNESRWEVLARFRELKEVK